MTNFEIINGWDWNAEEIKALETIGYSAICEKISNLSDEVYDKIY